MKRASVLALWLALAPLTWAEEAGEEVDFIPSTEMTEDDGAEPMARTSPVEANPPASPVAAPVASPAAAPLTAAPMEESAGTPSETPADSAPASHTVVRGDTLWGLAGAYLHDPFLWPKIFDANKDKIQNPRLIFPDQEFVLPTVEAAANLKSPPAPPGTLAAEEVPSTEPIAEVLAAAPSTDTEVAVAAEEVDPAEGVAPAEEISVDAPDDFDDKTMDEREAKKKKSLAVPGAGFMGGTADSFLADENWEYDGYVLRDRDQRLMISQGDVVFLNIGAASGVKPKMAANVYRVGKKVKDPYLKKKTGRMVKRVGSVVVTGQVTDEGCTAVVTNSLEPIRIGDIVKFVER